MRRRIRRWAVRGIVFIVLVVGLGSAAWVLRDMYQPPANLYREAERLAGLALYREASDRYEAFAVRNPGDPLGPTAQFEAAQVLANIIPSNQDDRTELNRRALALYQAFLEKNPGHPKAARAARLVAQLQFELGQYEDVIRGYRPELQAQDPASALPALRLMARAYEHLGEAEHAESAYLRAASMDGNLTPERDYEALGDLQQRLAERSDNEGDRIERYTRAIAYLDRAQQSPSIERAVLEKIEVKRNAWQAELAGIGGNDRVSEAVAGDAPARPTPESDAGEGSKEHAAESGAEEPESVLNREIDATAEAKHLHDVTTIGERQVEEGPARIPGATP